MAPEQWPQGGRERRGKVINCLGVMEAEIGLSLSSHESLHAVWIDWQCMQEMNGAPMNNLYVSLKATQKDGAEKRSIQPTKGNEEDLWPSNVNVRRVGLKKTLQSVRKVNVNMMRKL